MRINDSSPMKESNPVSGALSFTFRMLKNFKPTIEIFSEMSLSTSAISETGQVHMKLAKKLGPQEHKGVESCYRFVCQRSWKDPEAPMSIVVTTHLHFSKSKLT